MHHLKRNNVGNWHHFKVHETYIITRDVRKTLCPEVFFLSQMFCTTGLVSSKWVAQDGCLRKAFNIDQNDKVTDRETCAKQYVL